MQLPNFLGTSIAAPSLVLVRVVALKLKNNAVKLGYNEQLGTGHF
jgi:hypothetical protein